MTTTHGFERIRTRDIPELNTRAELFRHARTGAELLSLINDDENKVFGITFRTPPPDSTGVAHILEHSVLCGSRKYPVKEPFVELLKGSLKTFLNAMTYPDKTCYPVASQNVQDFYNLIDVYLDAVFHPRITPAIFQQEGWHFEVDRVDGPMVFKGVVYNEMKGAYSSPDSLLAEYSQQTLFPDTPYGLDSGGHPRQIPDLTYEQFREFHRRYYHPSNARLFFYGDDDPDTRLEIAEGYLRDFDRLEIDSSVPVQEPFSEPLLRTEPFDPGEDEQASSKGMVTVNWVLAAEPEPEDALACFVLDYILLGMPGSPLRKALIDSGLGEALAGGGLESELRQMFFSTGLKGVRTEDADRVEPLILDTLKRLSRDGIDPRTVEAAVNTLEFGLRENNTGHFPRGLLLMLRSLTTWLYDRDPLALVAFEAPLSALKSRIGENGSLFSGMIERLFLDNPHRATVVLAPEPGLSARQAAGEQERLRKAREAMGPEELQQAVETTKTLRELQEKPDPPEALASIPTLRLEDLPPGNKEIPEEVQERGGTDLLLHDLFTNGITYLDVGLNLHALRPGLLPYVRLFGRALLEMGTESEDYVSLSQRISRKTGGIVPSYFLSAAREDPRGAAWMFLRAKAMTPKAGDLMEILRDVLLGVRLDDRERFRQIVLESKARKEQGLVPSGHQVVSRRLSAHFGEASWAAEQMSGLNYLFFLRELLDMVDREWPAVLSALEEVRSSLVRRGAVTLNVTVDQEGWSRVDPLVTGFLESLPDEAAPHEAWSPIHPPRFEGLTIPAQVNYVGKGAVLDPLGYGFHGSALVITRHLRNAWLWDRIRVQGGAYGAFCNIDRLSNALTFVSYRDPNLLETLKVFDDAGAFLRSTPPDRNELTKAVVGTIGEIDQYRLPDAAGHVSLLRRLTGQTEAERQKVREEVLGTTANRFRAFAEVLDGVRDTGLVKVLGSRDAIEKASADHPGWLEIRNIL
ncbi:MAG: insulinase family protein [Deltaproteobacteria bacterium]|nr:insulinase family protein [Deltaproteobacteria bacterium]